MVCRARGQGQVQHRPYPACVGWLDRELPGWTRRELDDSLELVRTLMVPNWDIHPEMVTHTRVIDTKTGHPYPETQPTLHGELGVDRPGKSADELGDYLAYALRILKNVGLPCEGITTPGGFGNRVAAAAGAGDAARPSATSSRRRSRTTSATYHRRARERGARASSTPRGLDGARSALRRHRSSAARATGPAAGTTLPPGGRRPVHHRAICKAGRMVEVIARGEPAIMVCHWTGHLLERRRSSGSRSSRKSSRRLHARFDNLVWMKLSEIARYWAAKELTRIEWQRERVAFRAPFACPRFTLRVPPGTAAGPPRLRAPGADGPPLKEVRRALDLSSGTWCATPAGRVICVDLPRGASELEV